jgi:ribosomal protein S18 acetylase RimI-like enzyme
VFVRFLPLAGAVESKADEYYISNVGVLPEFQNLGYGAQLLAFAEQQARAAGLSKCSLTVDFQNHAALRLYERLGYKIVYSKTFTGEVARHESGYNRLVKNLN